jgi:hypothetical protein
MLWLGKKPGLPGGARQRAGELERGRYSHGWFLIRRDQPESARVKDFILDREFLAVPEARRIPTHNKRYRVWSLRIVPFEHEFIMKATWNNPAYRPLRRLNVMLSNRLRCYSGRALLGALALERAGVATIRPLACWRHRCAWWAAGESFLLYEKVPAQYSVRDFRLNKMRLPEERHRAVVDMLIDKLADIMAAIHGNGLRHDDTASGNFLVRSEGHAAGTADLRGDCVVTVIDTDHVAESRWPTAFLRRFFALRCLRRLDFDEAGRRRFLERYFGEDYREFWWRVHEFWRRGGNRPLRAAIRRMRRG